MKGNFSFSLIEVSCALLIVGLVIGGMLMIFSWGFRFADTIRKKTVAYNLARKILEEYFDWSRLDKLDGNYDGKVRNGSYTLSSYTVNNVRYTPVLSISNGPDSPIYLKRIKVTVFWEEKNFSVDCLKAHY